MTSRIRELRLALRARFGEEQYGIRACARRAGLSERSWGAYERGENIPAVDVAQAIARVLGVSVEQLEVRRVEADR